MAHGCLQVISAWPFGGRQRRLARDRPPISEGEFVQQILRDGGDEEAASLIYRCLLDWVYVSGFTPGPHDSLQGVFGVAEEERDEDLILWLLERLEIPLPSPRIVRTLGPVETPLQLAMWIRRLREGHAPPSPRQPDRAA